MSNNGIMVPGCLIWLQLCHPVNITLWLKLQLTITYQITVKIAICFMSNNSKMRAFPSKKFAIIVPAKQVRMLETQQDIGWV